MLYVTDNSNGFHISPAHDYLTVSEFECILGDIDRDIIPTGTGQTFPVVWPSDFDEDADDTNLYEFYKRIKEQLKYR